MIRLNAIQKLDGFTLVFPFLLILAGFFLLMGTRTGAFSIDAVERFWPLAIVAAGLVDLDPLRQGEK